MRWRRGVVVRVSTFRIELMGSNRRFSELIHCTAVACDFISIAIVN
jgi:hypothetical protein